MFLRMEKMAEESAKVLTDKERINIELLRNFNGLLCTMTTIRQRLEESNLDTKLNRSERCRLVCTVRTL
jgi:hypothetical protein